MIAALQPYGQAAANDLGQNKRHVRSNRLITCLQVISPHQFILMLLFCLQLLGQRLYGNSLFHHLVEIILCHLGQHAVDGFLQLRVALL